MRRNNDSNPAQDRLKNRPALSLFLPGRGQRLLFLLAAVVLAATACKDKPEDDGLTKQQRAIKEVAATLILPPDSVLRSTEVKADIDMLVLSYGTNYTIEELEGFFRKALADRGLQSPIKSDVGISYTNEQRRLVTVTWYARDPDLSEFKSVFHVAVVPMPKELKEPETK